MSITSDDILAMFKERSALLHGHFKLTSGLHSDSYMQCALLLQYACDADRLGAELSRKFRDAAQEKPITAVVSPALGGIVLGYVIARPLGRSLDFRGARGWKIRFPPRVWSGAREKMSSWPRTS